MKEVKVSLQAGWLYRVEREKRKARRQRKENKKNREKHSGWIVKEDQGRETTYGDKRNMEDRKDKEEIGKVKKGDDRINVKSRGSAFKEKREDGWKRKRKDTGRKG